MEQMDKPIFPLKIFWLDEDPIVVEEYNDLESVVTDLEFFTSYYPGVLVLDRENRPVRLVIYAFDVKCFELYDTTPLTQEEIAQIHREALQKLAEEREQGLLRRIIRWFKR